MNDVEHKNKSSLTIDYEGLSNNAASKLDLDMTDAQNSFALNHQNMN